MLTVKANMEASGEDKLAEEELIGQMGWVSGFVHLDLSY